MASEYHPEGIEFSSHCRQCGVNITLLVHSEKVHQFLLDHGAFCVGCYDRLNARADAA